MAKKTINNIKLGLFVLAGLAFLILLLYMIGSNSSLFQATYILRARFDNTQGLVAGNNVRFAGIESGTVKKITIQSDTVIEVVLLMNKDMQKVIRKNAVASIGTEGLVGNKLVNIVPSTLPSELAESGDLLESKKSVDTDDMLRTLSKTNDDVGRIAEELQLTIQRINNSEGLWALLNDRSTPQNIQTSIRNVRSAAARADQFMEQLNVVMSDVRNGKGSIGVLLSDTQLAKKVHGTVAEMEAVGAQADSLGREIRKLIEGVEQDVNNGNGLINTVFKDSLIVRKLQASLDNIQMGTDGFNQNMEALRHNFLFRGYFRKLDKQNKKFKSTPVASQR